MSTPALSIVDNTPAVKRTRKPRAVKVAPVVNDATPTRTPRMAKKPARPYVSALFIRAIMAAIAAGILPVASYMVAHYETTESPAKWVLVVAALIYSSPTLANWATEWCGSRAKAWGFTICLEGMMLWSSTPYLAPAGLFILAGINCATAYNMATKVRKI